MSTNSSNQLFLIQLPDDVLEKIMSKMSYDEIARKRIVCKRFNSICKGILNRKGRLLKIRIEEYMKDMKKSLPRRESARQAHPRNKHLQVLYTLSVYLNCLLGKYDDYIEKDLCCFIPGLVIDEANKILKLLEDSESLAKSVHDICHPFYEIVVMAQEHFDEVIKPSLVNALKEINTRQDCLNNVRNKDRTLRSCFSLPVPTAKVSMKKDSIEVSRKLHYRLRRNRIALLCVKSEIGKIRSRLHKQIIALNALKKGLEYRLECVEQKLNCSRQVEKPNPLEICEKIFSHIKSICESHSAITSNAENQESSIDQQFNLEGKIDRLTTLLTDIYEHFKL